MLHNHEISPSKDNLIFSSMEDLQIHSIDLDQNSSPKKSSGDATADALDLTFSKEKLTRNNSLNITKSKSKVKTHVRHHTQDHIKVMPFPDPDAIFTAKRQQQQNLILVQQQQQHQQKSILRNGGGSIDGGGGKGDEGGGKIDYETIQEVEDYSEGGLQSGPRVVTVDEEVDGRSTFCCWGFRVRRDMNFINFFINYVIVTGIDWWLQTSLICKSWGGLYLNLKFILNLFWQIEKHCFESVSLKMSELFCTENISCSLFCMDF